jgi:hypothetical protein
VAGTDPDRPLPPVLVSRPTSDNASGRLSDVSAARRGVAHGSGPGKTRWVVERTLCATRRPVCIPGSTGRNSEGGSWAE